MKKLLLATTLIATAATGSFAEAISSSDQDVLTDYIESTWFGTTHNVPNTVKSVTFIQEAEADNVKVSVRTSSVDSRGLPVYEEVDFLTLAEENTPVPGGVTLKEAANTNIDGVVRTLNAAAFGNEDANSARTIQDLIDAIDDDLTEFPSGGNQQGALGTAWFKVVAAEADLAGALVSAAIGKNANAANDEIEAHASAIAAFNSARDAFYAADDVAAELVANKF